MDEAARERILQRVEERQRHTPVHIFLFGFAWIVLSIVVLAGVELRWAPGLSYFFLGVALLYLGAVISERQKMSNSFRELLQAFESFNRSIYGDDYKVKRAAVDILIQALGNDDPEVRKRAHAQLVRITGMQFTIDAESWISWWSEARAGFTGPVPKEASSQERNGSSVPEDA